MVYRESDEPIHEVKVQLGEEICTFWSFENWCAKASTWLPNCGVPEHLYICIDAKGRICKKGKEFNRAKDENAFPVKVYCVLLE